MNNIQLNIVANAQFQQVYAEVAKLKEAMLSLQKSSVGGPFTPQVTASIRQAQQAFDSAVLSTRAFNIEQVAMSSSVERFGKQLAAGKLSLSNYYKIWRDSAKGVSAELDTLAASQARLNRSVAIADPLKPGYAKLVTDINGVVTAQEKAIFYQKALNTALQQGSIKLIDFGKNTQWMGRQLTVGLTMPLALFGAGVANSFKQVDAELTRMQKVYGTGLIQPTQAALQAIRSQIVALGNDLARTLGTSMQETAAMSADLAATGLEGAKLVGATREAIRLATLGELDHQQAMQATISLQNVYKLNTEGLTQAVNFLNAVENQTSTSLQDLVDAIPRVGPIVKQLGGSFKDTAAMMVAMKEAGVPAAQGANAIKSALSSLINPTKSAQTAFKAYNIDLQNIARSTGGAPILMLKALADQMKNLDRLTQAQLIEKMFGKYQFARIQALLDNINKSGSQTATVFNLMGASTADLAKLADNELKQQTESASGRFKRMTESLKADLLPVGQSFLRAFTNIGNAVDKVVRAIQALGKFLGPTAGLLGKVFGGGLAGLIVIGPLIMLVGLFSNLIGNIMRGANALRMFRQGMEQAGTTENKFLAGLHGMRNFYEDLDKSMIASRNQLNLMPESITTSAKAFDILNASIRTLTGQFEALAAAQRSSMGIAAVEAAAVGSSIFKIPFSHKMATGGWVPGNPSLGDVYPAMLTGQEVVIPYPNSVKHASILNAIMDDNLPKYGTGKKTSPMYAAGMYKAPSSIQAQTTKMSWGTLEEERAAIEAAARPILENKYQALVDLGKITAEQADKKVQLALDNLNRVQASHKTEDKLTTTLPQSGRQITYKDWKASNLAPDLGAINNYVNTLNMSDKVIDDFTAHLKASGKSIPVKELEDFRKGLPPLTQKQAQVLRDLAEYDMNIRNSYQGAAASAALGARLKGDYYQRLGAGELAYNSALDAKVAQQMQKRLQKLDQVIISTMANTMNEVSRSASDSKETKQAAANIAGGAVHELKDPKYIREAQAGGAQIAQSEINAVKQQIPQAAAVGAALGSAEIGGMASGGSAGGGFFAGGYGDGGTKSKFMSKYSNAAIAEKLSGKGGMLGKLGGLTSKLGGGKFGLAAMMAPMALNMIPNKIGGSDVSGAKSVLGNVSSVVGMASFIPGLQEFTIPLAIGTALFSGISNAFKNADRKRKEFEQGVRDSYKKLESTPDKLIEKIQKQMTYSDKVATSYKDMTIYGKVYGDTLYNLFDQIGSGALKGKQLETALSAINNKSQNVTVELTALKNAAVAAGNTTMVKLQTSIEKVYGKTKDTLSLMVLLTQLAGLGIDTSGIKPEDFKDKKKLEEWKSALVTARKTASEPQTSKTGQALQSQSDALKKRIKSEELIKKNLEDQLKAMQDQAKTIQQQNDYLNKQTDLTQQIKQAEVTGNYMQAAQLRTVKQQESAKYIEQQAEDAKQAQIDAVQKVIDDLNAKQADLQDAISKDAAATAANSGAVADLTAAINILDGFIKKLKGGDFGNSTYSPPNAPKFSGAKTTTGGPTTIPVDLANANYNKDRTSVVLHQGQAGDVFPLGQTKDGKQIYHATAANFINNGRGLQKGSVVKNYTWADENGKRVTADIIIYDKQDVNGTSQIFWTRKAKGGPISGPGTWTSDSIPALLSQGEFVMRSDAVSKYGLGMMYALNNRMYNVPGPSASVQGGNANAQTINFYINGSSDPQAVANMVMAKLKTINAKINKTNMVIK